MTACFFPSVIPGFVPPDSAIGHLLLLIVSAQMRRFMRFHSDCKEEKRLFLSVSYLNRTPDTA